MLRRYRVRPMFRSHHRLPSFLLPLLMTVVASALLFQYISAQLSPVIKTIAESKAKNLVTQMAAVVIDDALYEGKMNYEDFISAETGAAGQITSLSFRTAESVAFKRKVTERIVGELEQITSEDLAIPLGTLSGVLFLSAVGPSVRVRVQSVGDITAEYQNEFTSAGVNQTRHSVYLELMITVYLLIPGEVISVTSCERVCVAETIIVGEVPDTYLNLLNEVQ